MQDDERRRHPVSCPDLYYLGMREADRFRTRPYHSDVTDLSVLQSSQISLSVYINKFCKSFQQNDLDGLTTPIYTRQSQNKTL